MSQITLVIRHAPHSEQLLRWQMTVNAAFAGGSVTAALINLGALIAVSMARSALSQLALARSPAGYHG
jgi:hypothetical protein